MKPGPAARDKARNFRQMGWGSKSQNVFKKSRGCHETFARGFSSIRVQPSSGCSGWKEFEEKPRGGSRGVIDTQSFRLLDQEEEVSATRGYSSPACVSTLPLLGQVPVDSLRRKDRSMKSKSLVRTLALVAALAISAPLFAKPVAKSLPLTRAVKVGKVDVKAGDYRAMIDDNHFTLLSGKKVIAESAGR